MDEEKWTWVTWVDNGKSAYNGKTHKVPVDTLINPTKEIKPGDRVTVYWESGKKKFWNAIVADPQDS